MTTDFELRAAPEARCPMCRSLLIGMSGTHAFRMFPAKKVTDDFFGDGSNIDAAYYPAPAVRQFTATFVPCGCEWHARVNEHELRRYLLYIIRTDAGVRFEFGPRQPGSEEALYIMTTERTTDETQ